MTGGSISGVSIEGAFTEERQRRAYIGIEREGIEQSFRDVTHLFGSFCLPFGKEGMEGPASLDFGLYLSQRPSEVVLNPHLGLGRGWHCTNGQVSFSSASDHRRSAGQKEHYR